MDPKTLLQQRLTEGQALEKSFGDRLKERRGFVQNQENTASPIFARLMEAPGGEARVASGDIINPLRNFTTENTRQVQAAEADLDRITGRNDQALQALVSILEGEKDRSLQERQLALSAAEKGAVYDPKTNTYKIAASAMNPELMKGEGDLRKEFSDEVKNTGFKDVQAAYSKVKNASATPAGDLSLVFAYMKMLDPGSAVREGEYANAENTAGVPEQIRNQYNKALRGDKLSNKQRQGFKNEAATIYNSYIERHNSLVDSYDTLATQYGLDKKRVTGATGKVTPVAIAQGQDKGVAPGTGAQQSLGDKVLNFLFGGYKPQAPLGIGQSNQKKTSGGFTIEEVK